jgi:hypothetical protein
MKIVESTEYNGDNLSFEVHTNAIFNFVTVQYNNNNFYVRSPFIGTSVIPIRKKNNGAKDTNVIIINPNGYDALDLVEMLHDYDKRIEYFINKKYGNLYKCFKQVIANYDNQFNKQPGYRDVQINEKLNNITLRFNEKNDRIMATVYNYNISQKYEKCEKVSKFKIDDIKRFMVKNKEIRVVFRPVTWIYKPGKIYGTYLIVNIVEMRYNSAKINSEVISEISI